MIPVSIYLGVDVGSSYVKLVALNDRGEVLLRSSRPSVEEFDGLARDLRDRALRALRMKPAAVLRTVATGYGRDRVSFATFKKTELACHALGAFKMIPNAMTLVDIGGQDNKVIRVREDGSVDDFALNRKCAAGTGSFLEVIARRLGAAMEELPALALRAQDRVVLSSFCTVFAETEILERVKMGEPKAELAMAAYRSIAKRVTEMARLTNPVVLSGGVGEYHPPVPRALEELLGAPVRTLPHSQFTGAVGAAWFALTAGTLPESREVVKATGPAVAR